MSWAKVDDNFPHHPKTILAGTSASFLFICGLCYCRRFHTDGFISADAVQTLGASTHPKRLAARLVMAGLWEQTDDGGYLVHDYAVVYAESDETAREEKDTKIGKRRAAATRAGRAARSPAAR